MNRLRLGATGSLILLFAINLANYIDRFLVIALSKPIQAEFTLSNEDVGWLTTAFILVYMFASPVCGWLADRVPRRHVIASAVALWSLATAFASKAWSYQVLLSARGAVGIGESGYNAAGQALLSDLYPPEKRNRAMAFFTLAMPIGAALGFVLAGIFQGQKLGWRSACFWVGLPGLVLAFLALLLAEPVVAKEPTSRESEAKEGCVGTLVATLQAYSRFFRDPVYLTNALGFAGQAFALGGLGQWASHFLVEAHHQSEDNANFTTGGIVAGAGFVGTVLGALLADKLAKRGGMIPTYALVTGAGYLIAAPLLFLGLFLPLEPALVCLFLAMVGAFLGTGPSNAIVSACAPPAHRAKAFALVIVLLHLLGDASSPPILGRVADWREAASLPKSIALQQALFLTPVALVVAAVFMGACAFLARKHEGVPGAAPAH